VKNSAYFERRTAGKCFVLSGIFLIEIMAILSVFYAPPDSPENAGGKDTDE
jgi:hypothetical protein